MARVATFLTTAFLTGGFLTRVVLTTGLLGGLTFHGHTSLQAATIDQCYGPRDPECSARAPAAWSAQPPIEVYAHTRMVVLVCAYGWIVCSRARRSTG